MQFCTGFCKDGERTVPSLSGEISFIGGQEGKLAGPGSAAAETSSSFPLSPAYSRVARAPTAHTGFFSSSFAKGYLFYAEKANA